VNPLNLSYSCIENYKEIKYIMSFDLATLKKITNHPLTKKNKLMALYRYANFHFKQILFKSPVIYNFIDNVKFIAEKGMAGIVGNIYTGLYDFEEMSFLLHFLDENDLFLDIGANVGAYTLLASGACKTKSIAIEPVPNTYKQLLNNIKLNSLETKVTAKNIGIGAHNSLLKFTSDRNSMNRVLLKDENNINFVEVNVLTVDQILEGLTPSLIKVDIEGFEYEALKGSEKLLSNKDFNAVIIELNNSGQIYGYDDTITHDLLSYYGFSPYKYEPFTRNLVKLDKFNTDKFNTIYLKNLEKVLDKIKRSRKIQIFNYYY